MSIKSQKEKIFGQIAAAKTLTTGLPTLKNNSSFPSINNNGDSITFLCDLIKSLIGYEELQQTISDTLTYSLQELEKDIKASLKDEIKSIVSCGINPSLPDFIKSTGDGINLKVNQLDFTELMMVDPRSAVGKVLYKDLTPNLINSSDFNTFLYQTIQNDGTSEDWPHIGNGILSFKFNSIDVSGISPNNTLNIKATSNYDSKSLTDLNNNFIDSLTLFDTEDIFTRLIESAVGTISNTLGKSLKQLENEAKIDTVINKISNSNSKDVINDKYFSFTNAENAAHQADAIAKKSGTKTITTTGPINTSISFQTVSDMHTSIAGSTTTLQKNAAVNNSLTQMGNQVASYTNNPTDHQAVKLNFIQELINNLIKVVVNTILSPKVITLFVINFKIIYGPNAVYGDAIDFLKQNKNFIHNMTKRIGGLIIKILLHIAIKELTKLITEAAIKQQTDKQQANLAQLLSLVGIPPDVLRQIQGLL